MGHSPGTSCITSSDVVPALKFHSVEICNCTFFSPPAPVTLEEHNDVCTPDDKVCFFAALAKLPGFLQIDVFTDDINNRGPSQFLSEFLRTDSAEVDRFKATRLYIRSEWPLSTLEYAKLGSMLQQSEQLTDLTLFLPFMVNLPREFLDQLASLVHLRMLYLHNYQHYGIRSTLGNPLLTDGEYCFGMVELLVRNPQSQLIELDLYGIAKKDHHLVTLAQLLPSSRIRTLKLYDHEFTANGFLEFAHQLPNMLSLNSVSLGHCSNLSRLKEDMEACGKAFLQGLIENPSITWSDAYYFFPQRPLMLHYLSLNRAGRKLLSSSSQEQPPIPDGLWPLILERAGASRDGHGPHFIFHNRNRTDCVDHGPVNAVFFFLMNCPRLLSFGG